MRIRRQRGVVVEAGHVGDRALRRPFGQIIVDRQSREKRPTRKGTVPPAWASTQVMFGNRSSAPV